MADAAVRCSVVVPTYNRADLLALTLESLLVQDLGVDGFEVLVVDDGSSDNTREVAKSFSDRLQLRYLFQEDRGYRVAKARNTGIRAAVSPVCVLIDSGILLGSGCLSAHCERHEESPEPLAVCGYVYGFNEDNEDAEVIRHAVDPRAVDATLARLKREGMHLDLREEFYGKYSDEFNDLPAPWLVYWTCNVSATRELLMAAGLFDENFTTWGGEDVELAYRMHRHGCRFVLERAAHSIHYPHEKSYERNMRDAKTSYRYFADKYGTPITALVPDNHFWVINDIIRRENLPRCEDYLKQHDGAAAR